MNEHLERIFQEGTQVWVEPHDTYTMRTAMKPTGQIECEDGFKVSVIAGWGTYCAPRPEPFRDDSMRDYEGPYYEVEVGFPSERPEPWDKWAEWCLDPDAPTNTVYGFVPIVAVRALVNLHGGEVMRHANEPVSALEPQRDTGDA